MRIATGWCIAAEREPEASSGESLASGNLEAFRLTRPRPYDRGESALEKLDRN